jgi:hypothetical protein
MRERALFEIKLPDSYSSCPLYQGQNGFMVCVGTDKDRITGRWKEVPTFDGFDKWNQRASFCPLKIVEEAQDETGDNT